MKNYFNDDMTTWSSSYKSGPLKQIKNVVIADQIAQFLLVVHFKGDELKLNLKLIFYLNLLKIKSVKFILFY